MRLVFIIAIVAVASLLVVRCTTPAAILHYRITVEVDTPDGRKSGSSVMELVLNRKFFIGMPGVGGADYGGGWSVFGEMPVIDLGEGRTLFTLRHDRHYRPEHAISDVVLNGLRLRERRQASGQPSDEAIVRDLNARRPSAEVRGDRWPAPTPALALFSDTRNPKTLTEMVSATSAAPEIAPYTVSGVTIAVVGRDEPLTTTLAARFPELAAIRGLLALNERGERQHY